MTSYHSSKIRLFVFALTSAAAGLFSIPCTATNANVFFCASTATELQDDLTAASDGGANAGDFVEIKLVRGTYKTGAATGNKPFTYRSTSSTGNLELIGGFGNVDCAFETLDASLTILDGKNLTQVLNVQSTTTPVSIEYVTLQNGESATAGGGLAVNTEVTGGQVSIYWDIIQNNHTASIGGGFAIDGAGSQVALINNLVVNNSADGNYGAGFEFSRHGAEAFVNSNTIANNTTTASGGTGGLYCCGDAGIALIAANIFWQNTNFGIDEETASYSFKYNDFGTMTGVVVPDVSNISKDPKFIDSANGNYRLSGNSPLLGFYPDSNGILLDLDLAGDGIPSIGFCDVGAYEDTVFTDGGFEGD